MMTRQPGDNPRGMKRTWKLQAHTGDGNRTPNPG